MILPYSSSILEGHARSNTLFSSSTVVSLRNIFLYLFHFLKARLIDYRTFCFNSFSLNLFFITPRTSGFLVESFHGTRQSIMNRVPDIRFIDSHAKCFCRYHPSEFVIFIFSLYQRLFFFQRFVTGISFWSTARIPFYPGFKFPLKLPAQLVASLSPIDIRCKDQSTSRITLLQE